MSRVMVEDDDLSLTKLIVDEVVGKDVSFYLVSHDLTEKPKKNYDKIRKALESDSGNPIVA